MGVGGQAVNLGHSDLWPFDFTLTCFATRLLWKVTNLILLPLQGCCIYCPYFKCDYPFMPSSF
jgi:hypothetical protein